MFEASLFPPFQEILQQDVTGIKIHYHHDMPIIVVNTLLWCINYRYVFLVVSEFIPYVFQILSLMLELYDKTIPDSYMALFPFLLAPVLWERLGNIPPLVRLLRAYVEKGGEPIYAKLVSLNPECISADSVVLY